MAEVTLFRHLSAPLPGNGRIVGLIEAAVGVASSLPLLQVRQAAFGVRGVRYHLAAVEVQIDAKKLAVVECVAYPPWSRAEPSTVNGSPTYH